MIRVLRGNQPVKHSTATIHFASIGWVVISNSVLTKTTTTATSVTAASDVSPVVPSHIILGSRAGFGRQRRRLAKTTGSLKEVQSSSSSSSSSNTTPPEPYMLKRWKSRDGERDKFRLRDDDGFRIRAAALCIKGTGKEACVLLVSGGKDGAKWVVPGGGVEKDECVEEAAHRELMEEAGVRANTLSNIGLFQDDVRKHRTQVFVMEVSEELPHWEENEYGRQRIWMPLPECVEKVKQSHRPMIEALLAR